MTLRLLSEDCFKQLPGDSVWVILCGEDEKHWDLFGLYWSWDMVEAQLERAKIRCGHAHGYRKATRVELIHREVQPSWIPAPHLTSNGRVAAFTELSAYLHHTRQFFPEGIKYGI